MTFSEHPDPETLEPIHSGPARPAERWRRSRRTSRVCSQCGQVAMQVPDDRLVTLAAGLEHAGPATEPSLLHGAGSH